MTAPAVTISILAFHTATIIERCVRSCLELDYGGPIEIVVREQGGNEAETAQLRAIAREDAARRRSMTVSSGPNLGFSGGHNLAIRASRADLVLVLNADATVDMRFLTNAIGAFVDPRVGAVQGKVLLGTGAGALVDAVGLQPLLNRSVKTRGHGAPDDGRFEEPEEIFGPDGAVALFRRSALEDAAIPFSAFQSAPRPGAEYFDESFFAYKEDVDLAWRLQWRGWRTMYEPEAIARHGRGVKTTAVAGPRQALADRMRMSPTARALGFANQRLMQIKNEDGRALVRASGRWLPRELGAWGVGLVTDPRLVRAASRLVRLTPMAVRKRRFIRESRAPGADPYHWFEGKVPQAVGNRA